MVHKRLVLGYWNEPLLMWGANPNTYPNLFADIPHQHNTNEHQMTLLVSRPNRDTTRIDNNILPWECLQINLTHVRLGPTPLPLPIDAIENSLVGTKSRDFSVT